MKRLLAALALGGCQRLPPTLDSPAPEPPEPMDSTPATPTGATGVTGATGTTGDTGAPEQECIPGLTRRLSGDLDLAVNAWATVDGVEGSFFGYSVLGLGDLTGDGYDDLAVHAFSENFGTDVGGDYVFPGPLPAGAFDARMDGIRLVDDDPSTGYDYLNGPVYHRFASLPDISGDGFPDLAIGVQSEKDTPNGLGAVYLTSSPIGATPPRSWPFAESYGTRFATDAGYFGKAVSPGDFDGDGIGDLAVTSQDASNLLHGQVHLFLGPILPGDLDEHTAHALVSTDPSSVDTISMGGQVVAVDLTGDGADELVVSASTTLVDGVLSSGEVYIWEGPITRDLSTLDVTGTLQGDPTLDSDNFGVIANPLGDTDGDGYEELGVTSQGDAPTSSGGPGNAYLFDGPIVGTHRAADRADTHFYGLGSTDQSGFAAPAGDLDQDGLADVAIGTVEVDGDSRGAVFLYYGALPSGSHPINASPDATLWGEGGWPVAIDAAGDLDGDCMPDLVVGARFANRAYILRGGTF